MAYYCTRGCGYSYTSEISTGGHVGNGIWVYDSNGSSSSVGTHHQNCKVCGTTMNAGTACSRANTKYSNGASNHYDACSVCSGRRYFDHKQKNRFLFAHNGIQVDLTTFCDVDDVDELYRKSFRHSLTIDSVGVRRDGMVSSSYNGMEDIRDKILRLTDENSTISEGLYRRILLMHVQEGYALDKGLRERLERENFFQKEGYRKKFCEIFVSGVRVENPNWGQIARMLGMPGCTLSHKSAFVSYAEGVTDADDRFKRTFIFLIMALLKVTSKELHPLMPGVTEMEYYDSLCANLTTKVDTQDVLKRLKGRYPQSYRM